MTTFFFNTTIERGPIYLDISVEVHYERSGPSYGPVIDILDVSAVDSSDEIPGLWPHVKAWVLKEYRERLTEKAWTLANNNDWDRRDRENEQREYQRAWRATA